MLAPVREEHGFGAAFALIVAGTDSVRVDVSPVVLGLRMDIGIAVHLARRCLVNPGSASFGKAEHVGGTIHARLNGLHGIVLVMHGRGGTGQVIDFVHFHIQREGDVVPQKFKAPVVQKFFDIGPVAGEEVVHAQNLVTHFKKAGTEVRTQESGAAGNQDAFT